MRDAGAVLISNPKGLSELRSAGATADYIATDLHDAANWVIAFAVLGGWQIDNGYVIIPNQ